MILLELIFGVPRAMLLSSFVYFCALCLARGDSAEPVSESFTHEGNVTDSDVTETQHATCRIVTEELVANARATVTRVLTGVCNAKTMEERFDSLERKLADEMEVIRTMLHSISKREKTSEFVGSKNDRSVGINRETKDNKLSPRQEEIDKLNNTIQEIATSNGTGSAFIYYWKVKEFDEKLSNWRIGRYDRSPTFHVGQNGYAMYLKITPKYFPDGTVFIGVGLTRGRYDPVFQWPFNLKLQLEVLDQSSAERKDDRRSRIWNPSMLCSEHFWGRPKLIGEPDNPECVGLSISRSIILSRLPSVMYQRAKDTTYLWNGTMVIKLTVYL